MTVVGVDFGERRVGVAVSDGLRLTAQPLTVVDAADAVEEVARIVTARSATRVVVGLPVGLNGREGAMASRARGFAAALAEAVDVPVEMWNEQFTSVEAERVLLEAGARRSRRRQVRDKVAAAVMLQGYLDAAGRAS